MTLVPKHRSAPSHSRRALAFLSTALVAGVVAACGGGDGGTGPEPTPTITVSVAPTTLSVVQGQSGTAQVTITRSTFTGPVGLAVTGAPSGMTPTLSATSLTGTTQSSALTVAVPATTAPGTYTLSIAGSGTGVASQSASLAVTVTAAPQTFAVALAGTGSGTVTSAPAGITCGATCAAQFASGTPVTLTAAAATGSTFAGWSGGCTGTTATCSVSMSAAQAVTATFNTAAVQSFTLALNPAAVSLPAGGSATSQADVTRAGGFTGAVALAATGAPVGLTVTVPTSVAGASGAVTIAATAAVAPGTYNVTVTGTGAGVAQQTATLAVTVTAAPAIALAVTPATVGVQQGATGSATVNVTRSGGFTGAVTLATSGAPVGVTVTPSPASVTSASSTLGITVGGSVPTGTYPITVTGTGTGVAQQTATFSVQVTQAPTGGGNVTYSFAGCDPTQVPIWFAAQNGTGPWTRVAPGANGTYSFTVGATGGVAYVTQSGATYQLTVFYASGAEHVGSGTRCGSSIAATGTKRLTGTVAGVGQTDQSFVSIGAALASVVPIAGTAFTLTNVPDGPRDLIATRSSLNPSTLPPTTALNKVIIRRGVNYANDSAIPTLDFGATEAFDPLQRTITIGNLGGDMGVGSVAFVTATGASAAFHSSLASGSALSYYTVPAARLQPTDYHMVTVAATPPGTSPTGLRGVQTFLRAGTDRTVTLGPALSTPTVTRLAATPYLRLRAQFASQTAYNGMAAASCTQATRSANVTATAAYFGGVPATWTLDIPDFAGVAAWDPTWGLQTGAQVTWGMNAFAGDFLALAGGTPTDGAQIAFASSFGSSSAFVRFVRSQGLVRTR